ncbi:MAG: 30S ribosomal protein S16 [Lachnospiraceae bacterium]|nr:30S ribosomal protein S16 [Lachnospiraceae bacterium]
MAVKIRLTRMGKKKAPTYRVIVADERAPRDGRFIDQIGFYDPTADPSIVKIDTEKAAEWIKNGAKPTDTVAKLLKIAGLE